MAGITGMHHTLGRLNSLTHFCMTHTHTQSPVTPTTEYLELSQTAQIQDIVEGSRCCGKVAWHNAGSCLNTEREKDYDPPKLTISAQKGLSSDVISNAKIVGVAVCGYSREDH